MARSCGSSTLATIVSVAGLALAGVGGFNLMSTGCPFGMTCDTTKVAGACQESGSQAATTLVSTSAPTTEGGTCCELEAALKAASTDACTGEQACNEGKVCSKAEECCNAGKAEVITASAVTATGACTEKVSSCDEQKDCTEATASECSEQKDCSDKPACDGEQQAEEVAGR